jgi:general secretion pathway protein D
MIRALAIAFLAANTAIAAPTNPPSPLAATLVFDDLPLRQLVKLALGEIARRPYVLDVSLPDVAVSLSLPNAEPDTVLRELNSILRSSGFTLECSSICRIVQSVADSREVVVYRPRHRTVAYLRGLLQPWFGADAFGGARSTTHTSVTIGDQPVPTSLDGNSTRSNYSASSADVIAFRGLREEVARFNVLVAEFDTPVPQLVVQASVYEVQTGSRDGSAWDIAASVLGGRLGFSFVQGDTGGGAISFHVGDVSAVYSALSGDSRFNVVASPRVRVASGSRATFSVGDEVPVLGAVVQTQTGTQQSVDYRPSGVILELGAEVHRDVARLTVRQQISQFAPTATGVKGSPTLSKRELSTELLVRPGDVVVIGGLDQTRATASNSYPSFARWLRSETTDDSRTQILVFLHVTTVDDAAKAAEATGSAQPASTDGRI